MRIIKTWMLLLLLYCIFFNVNAQSLQLGSPAPKIKVEKWIKGNSVETFQPGKIYVLEFWATWCGPCIAAVPHLSKLAKKYEDKVEFIGISVYEHNTDRIEPFLKEMEEEMLYAVAVDKQDTKTSKKGYMTETYLDALKVKAIPATIVIGKTGLIEWVGNPMDLEDVLEKLVNDRWNLTIKILQKKAQPTLDSISKAITVHTNWPELAKKLEMQFPYLSTDSVILSMQYNYFYKERKFENYIAKVIEYIEKYDPKVNPDFINFHGWEIFMKSSDSDRKQLLSAAKWFDSEHIRDNLYLKDTYANLLYKAGERSKAIGIQKKLLNSINDKSEEMLINYAISNYYSMLIGQPTWRKHDKPVNDNNIWQKVKAECLSFNSKYLDSIIYLRKVEYLKEGKLWKDFSKLRLEFVQANLSSLDAISLNAAAYDIFLYSTDMKDLRLALNVSNKSLQDAGTKYGQYLYAFYDTYANLLHKLGRKEEALIAMGKAIKLCPAHDKDEFKKTLAKIEKGEKTWEDL